MESIADFVLVRVHLFLSKASFSMLEQKQAEGKEQKALLEGLLSLYTEAKFLHMLCGTFF